MSKINLVSWAGLCNTNSPQELGYYCSNILKGIKSCLCCSIGDEVFPFAEYKRQESRNTPSTVVHGVGVKLKQKMKLLPLKLRRKQTKKRRGQKNVTNYQMPNKALKIQQTLILALAVDQTLKNGVQDFNTDSERSSRERWLISSGLRRG